MIHLKSKVKSLSWINDSAFEHFDKFPRLFDEVITFFEKYCFTSVVKDKIQFHTIHINLKKKQLESSKKAMLTFLCNWKNTFFSGNVKNSTEDYRFDFQLISL